MPRRLLLCLVALAVAGVAVRWAWVLAVDPEVPEVGDAAAYHLLAEGIASGDGYVRPFDRVLLGELRPTAEYAPLHPAYLAVADAVGIDGVTGQRLWLSLAGGVSVLATGVLAWLVSGRRSAPAVVAAAVAAVHPLWFQADATLMPETLAALWGAVAVGAAVLAVREPVRLTWIVLGLACGSAALTRGEAALLLPLVAVPAALAGTRRWTAAVVPVVAFAVVVGPWTLRNALRFDDLVPISTNVGSVLDGANCDATYGGDLLGYWSYSPGCFDGFLQEELAVADESVVAAEHRSQGVEYATDHAGDWPRVAAARLARTVAVLRPSQLADLGALEGREQGADVAGFVLVWATVVAGAVGAWRLRRAAARGWWVPVVAVVVIWGSTALSYGNPRFLAVAQPALVALAACGVVRDR